MGIDIAVVPLAGEVVGLSSEAIAAVFDLSAYRRVSDPAAPVDVPPPGEGRVEAMLASDDEIAAAEAGVRALQAQLAARLGVAVSWTDRLPKPLSPAVLRGALEDDGDDELLAWEEEAEPFAERLPDSGFDLLLGVASVLGDGGAPDSLEALIDADHPDLRKRVWAAGGGGYAHLLAAGRIETYFLPAPLPAPLLGPLGVFASREAMAAELERLLSSVFGLSLDPLEVFDAAMEAPGLRGQVLDAARMFASAIAFSRELDLPIVVSG